MEMDLAREAVYDMSLVRVFSTVLPAFLEPDPVSFSCLAALFPVSSITVALSHSVSPTPKKRHCLITMQCASPHQPSTRRCRPATPSLIVLLDPESGSDPGVAPPAMPSSPPRPAP